MSKLKPQGLYNGPETHVSLDQTTNGIIAETVEDTSYPKWMYHATKSAIVIGGLDEKDALGPEWFEAPVEDEGK